MAWDHFKNIDFLKFGVKLGELQFVYIKADFSNKNYGQILNLAVIRRNSFLWNLLYNLKCDPLHVFPEVNLTEYSGAFFQVHTRSITTLVYFWWIDAVLNIDLHC